MYLNISRHKMCLQKNIYEASTKKNEANKEEIMPIL